MVWFCIRLSVVKQTENEYARSQLENLNVNNQSHL
jgi:hypothetical protein